MNIELLNGQFNSKEAIDLISEMLHLKIKFHENKISNATTEEDIKFREAKIKTLQQQLYSFGKNIENTDGKVSLSAVVIVEM